MLYFILFFGLIFCLLVTKNLRVFENVPAPQTLFSVKKTPQFVVQDDVQSLVGIWVY